MNTLTIVACQLRQARNAPDGQVLAAIDQSVRMLCAHGQLHAALTLGQSGVVSVPDRVGLLCHHISDAILEPLGIRCEAVADEGLLPAATVETLGLIIHELVVNAAKHAFDRSVFRIIRIEVLEHAGAWSCTVTDNGCGLSPTQSSAGLGGGIVKGLVQRLGGSIAVKSYASGTAVAVLLPKPL